jgi:methylated-DNA-[protein]-cysteine S-methyltransferase
MHRVIERVAFNSTFGPMIIEGDDEHLFSIQFVDGSANEVSAQPETSSPVIADAVKQILAYAAGERTRFDLPYELCGTDFQKRVWQELAAIDFGERRSYGEIAGNLGNRNRARAVGQAAGRNPLLIIIPCHRLVGSGGRLGGFAAGLDLKRRLLDHEEAVARRSA